MASSVLFAGCGGSGSSSPSGVASLPNVTPPHSGGIANPGPTASPVPPQSQSAGAVTLSLRVPNPSKTRSGGRRPAWVSPSSTRIVLDTASINGTTSPVYAKFTQYADLVTSGSNANCKNDVNGFSLDCVVTFAQVPVGKDLLRITTTDASTSATAPTAIQPVAADGTTTLGAALSQNFVSANIVASTTSSCTTGSTVNCVPVTLDGVVYSPYALTVGGAVNMPAGAPAPVGYVLYVGFYDYDHNVIVNGGGGNLNLGDTAVYTSIAAGLANNPQGETLDSLFVTSTAQPLVLSDASYNGGAPTAIIQQGQQVVTTSINQYQYVVPTNLNPTTICAWDVPAGILGTSATACDSIVYTPGASATIPIN